MAGAELIGKEEIKEVMDVLETGILMRYGFDKERKGIYKVREFEEAFAKYCGVSYALGVTSGSAALQIALTAMDVGPGDEVLVPAFTFLATYEAVMEVGAIPVMVDIDDTLNLDPLEIEKKKTQYTKAVIPVHMCGSAPISIKSWKSPVEINCWFWKITLRDAAPASKAKNWAVSAIWELSALIMSKRSPPAKAAW